MPCMKSYSKQHSYMPHSPEKLKCVDCGSIKSISDLKKSIKQDKQNILKRQSHIYKESKKVRGIYDGK